MKIIDVFPYFNEIDILKIRMHELEGLVHNHVLVEAPFSYTMKSKPYHYYDGNEQFIRVCPIVIPKDDMKDIKPKSKRDIHFVERFQRNYVADYLIRNCIDEDIIIFSDIDEIPLRQSLVNFIESGRKLCRFKTRLYRYYYNLYFQPWQVSHMFRWSELKKWINDLNSIRTMCTPSFIKGDGWHFSSVGNFSQIWKKLNSFAHANEGRVKKRLSQESIKNRIKQKLHPFKDKEPGKIVPITDMPSYIIKNIPHFEPFLLKEK